MFESGEVKIGPDLKFRNIILLEIELNFNIDLLSMGTSNKLMTTAIVEIYVFIIRNCCWI